MEFQQHQRQWGEVVLLQPVSTKLLTWALTGAVALIIAFLTVAQYARKETAIGYLSPSAGTAQVFAPQQGVIREIYVTQGQPVREGQPLLKVATNQLADDGQDVNSTLLDILTAQKASLSKQIAAETARTNAERSRLTALIANLVSEGTAINEQIAAQKQRIEIGESLVGTATLLASKGLMSQVERKKREQAVLDDKQRLSSLTNQAHELVDRVIQTRSSLDQLATVMSGKLQPLVTELASTDQRIAETNARRGYVVRAPISGRVSLLQANVGQTVDPRRLEMEIVPANAVLQAVLLVPARAIGFVRAGQVVRLLYDAFPYQKYGTYTGHITQVSQTLLTGTEISGPVAVKEPVYRVVVALDKKEIKTADRTIPLEPDMLLRANIVLDRRTIMDWILSPVTSVRM